MIVIIAEKPSVARELAKIVGASVKKDGFIEGNGYAVTWAFGHLVQIFAPEADVAWRPENLPILPEQFYLNVGMTMKDGKKVPDDGYSHQLEIIKSLFDQAEYIINAGDAGREGELIQRYIYAYVGCTKPVKRLWISSLTDNAIREGLEQLHPSSEFDTLYAAGKARSEADWLVGINATRALSCMAGRGVHSLGRVQTPTLAMVCRRFIENRDFVPQAFWNIKVASKKDEVGFKAMNKERYFDHDKLNADVEAIKAAGSMTVTKMEKTEKSVQPPFLYDLTSLQQDANKKLGLSAQETLDTAQALYEKKVLTYPRTGSRFIPDDVFATLPQLLQKQEGHPKYGSYARSLQGTSLNRRSVDQTKVTDHHALLPTEVAPVALNANEQGIYDLVIARLLESISPKCEMLSTVAEFDSAGVVLAAKGNMIVKPGWRAVQGVVSSDDEKDDQDLPTFVVGDVLPVLGIEETEGKTKPKPLHTEASLLDAMKHAGKEVEDEDLKDALKEVGIGTPATRAGEIETILRRGYITRKGKSLIPTDKGMTIYEAVKDKYIANVEMTGRWETSLAKIVDGKVSAKAFDESIRRYVTALTSEILSDEANRAALMYAAADEDAIKCPKCGGPMKIWENNVKCRACGLSVWKEVAHKKLSDSMMRKLLTTGRTQVLKGFKSKSGNTFDASLVVKDDFTIGFDFSEVAPRKTAPQQQNAVSTGDPNECPPPSLDDAPYWM
ncbi:MAG: DNA topoisomerase 3 [Bacteroidales bacterium]|nr:DNA topoisomerase 3 [Bacteroidales bacterium]